MISVWNVMSWTSPFSSESMDSATRRSRAAALSWPTPSDSPAKVAAGPVADHGSSVVDWLPACRPRPSGRSPGGPPSRSSCGGPIIQSDWSRHWLEASVSLSGRLTGVLGRMRRLWGTLLCPRSYTFRPNAECPICTRGVVVPATTMMGNGLTGPMFSPATREEKIAACPEHGRSPFNEASIQAELG